MAEICAILFALLKSAANTGFRGGVLCSRTYLANTSEFCHKVGKIHNFGAKNWRCFATAKNWKGNFFEPTACSLHVTTMFNMFYASLVLSLSRWGSLGLTLMMIWLNPYHLLLMPFCWCFFRFFAYGRNGYSNYLQTIQHKEIVICLCHSHYITSKTPGKSNFSSRTMHLVTCPRLGHGLSCTGCLSREQVLSSIHSLPLWFHLMNLIAYFRVGASCLCKSHISMLPACPFSVSPSWSSLSSIASILAFASSIIEIQQSSQSLHLA